MNDEWKKQYDVFISYAHADADGAAGAGMVKQIKEEIEAALRPVSPHPFAFLDSEALKWAYEMKTSYCFFHSSFMDRFLGFCRTKCSGG